MADKPMQTPEERQHRLIVKKLTDTLVQLRNRMSQEQSRADKSAPSSLRDKFLAGSRYIPTPKEQSQSKEPLLTLRDRFIRDSRQKQVGEVGKNRPEQSKKLPTVTGDPNDPLGILRLLRYLQGMQSTIPKSQLHPISKTEDKTSQQKQQPQQQVQQQQQVSQKTRVDTRQQTKLIDAVSKLTTTLQKEAGNKTKVDKSKIPHAIPFAPLQYPQRQAGQSWSDVAPPVQDKETPSSLRDKFLRNSRYKKNRFGGSTSEEIGSQSGEDAAKKGKGWLGRAGKWMTDRGLGNWGGKWGTHASKMEGAAKAAAGGSSKASAAMAKGGVGVLGGAMSAIGGLKHAIESDKFGDVAGGLGAAAGGAISMLPIPGAAVVGTALGGLAMALGKATEKLREWNNRLMESNMQFAYISPKMAQAQAEHEVRQMELDRERGERRGDWAKKHMEASDRLNKAMAPMEDWWAKVKGGVFTSLSNGLASIIEAINGVTEEVKGSKEYEFMGNNPMREIAEEMERADKAMEADRPDWMR